MNPPFSPVSNEGSDGLVDPFIYEPAAPEPESSSSLVDPFIYASEAPDGYVESVASEAKGSGECHPDNTRAGEPLDVPSSYHGGIGTGPIHLETKVLPSVDNSTQWSGLQEIGKILGNAIAESIRLPVIPQESKRQGIEYKPKQPAAKQSAENPQVLAEKLVQLERFASYDRQLYIFDPSRGFYVSVDRDEAKSIALKCMQADLRIKGTANQLRDIYEFVRLDPRLKIVSAPPNHLLCFTNGILNIKDQTFYPGHHPEWFLNWGLTIPYEPTASVCPLFDRVIQTISGDEPVLTMRIWETIAYLIVQGGFQKAIILFQGVSDTGKSLLATLIGKFFHDDLISRVSAHQFRERFTAATLLGKRLNVSMDLPGGRLCGEAVAMLKQITGGDAVFVEQKGIDGHSARLHTRFLFGTNHAFKPAIDDEAFLRRIVLIPFRHPVSPETAVPLEELVHQLSPEFPAIFNKTLAAFYRLQANHFQFSGEDRFGIHAAGLGNTDSDPLLTQFIEEQCIFDEQSHTPTRDIFAAYNDFRTIHGYPINDNSQRFSQQFNEATPLGVYPKKFRVGGTPTNCYTGIKIKEA